MGRSYAPLWQALGRVGVQTTVVVARSAETISVPVADVMSGWEASADSRRAVRGIWLDAQLDYVLAGNAPAVLEAHGGAEGVARRRRELAAIEEARTAVGPRGGEDGGARARGGASMMAHPGRLLIWKFNAAAAVTLAWWYFPWPAEDPAVHLVRLQSPAWYPARRAWSLVSPGVIVLMLALIAESVVTGEVNSMGTAIETCETALAVVLVVGLLIAHLAVVLDMAPARRGRCGRRR